MSWWAYQAAMEEYERKKRREQNRGSMMYGRNYGSTQEPRGASGHFNPRTGEGHSTQYYDDNYRYSWETDGEGESNEHWTNQNVGKGHQRRHEEPPHAK